MRIATLSCLILVSVGCSSDPAPAGPGPGGGGTPQVAGTFGYSGSSFSFPVRGSITFTQSGTTVSVTEVTYDNADDRDLVGQAELNGNQLDIILVPKNGDTDFQADVTFIFDNDGDTFDCSFSDTNGDAGGLGSYSGAKE